MQKNSLHQKIALILFGLFLTIAILEIGLRIGGFIILSIQEYRNQQSIKQKGSFRIMCLGESTTQGQYPPYLEEILNQRNIGIKFSVIDKGMVGVRTATIVSQVESYLDEYHPDIVVAMIGINDGGIHIPYEKPSSSKPILLLRSFRVYKLTRLIWLHLVERTKEFMDNKQITVSRSGSLQDRFKEPGSEESGVMVSKDSLNGAQEINSNNDTQYKTLGWKCLEQGLFQEAIEYFKKELEIHPMDDEACVELGKAHRKLQQHQQAEMYLKRAMELNPNNEQLYVELAWFYEDKGLSQKAEECYKKALELNSENDIVWHDLGYLYESQGHAESAEECYKKAIKLKPSWEICLGMLYHDQGKLREAEKSYEEALGFGSESAYRALATLYTEMGYDERAEECYSKINELSSNKYDSIPAENYIRLKNILDRRKVKLVCVQYPMRNVEPLKKIFEEQTNIYFVDNNEIFREALKRECYKEYFRDRFAGDFGHCTSKGNRLLAENIANVILKEIFGK